MTEKLCKDCKYYSNWATVHRCMRPIEQNTSLITGTIELKGEYRLCEIERTDHKYMDRCGVEGKYWTPRKSFWEGLSDLVTKSL